MISSLPITGWWPELHLSAPSAQLDIRPGEPAVGIMTVPTVTIGPAVPHLNFAAIVPMVAITVSPTARIG